MFVAGHGLRIFDGERWSQQYVPNITDIFSISVADDSKVWLAGNAEVGFLARDELRGWQYHSLVPQVGQGVELRSQIWHLFADGDGAVFVTSDRLYRWDGKQMRSWYMPGARRLTLHRLDGRIYVGHSPTGIYLLGENGPTLVVPQSEIGTVDTGVLSILNDHGGWLVATSDGFVRLHEGKGTALSGAASTFLHVHHVTDGVMLREGVFAYGSVTGGILLVRGNGELIETLGESEGVQPCVQRLLVDRDGALWAVGPHGIDRVDASGYTRVFDARSGASDAYAIGAAAGVVALGDDQGVYELSPDHKVFQRVSNVPWAHNFYSTPDRILIPSYRSLWSRDQSKYEKLSPSSEHLDYQAAIPDRLTTPGVLAANSAPAIVRLANSTETVVANLPSAATSLAQDGTGNIWFTTIDGTVYVVKAGDRNECVRATKLGLPPTKGTTIVRSTTAGRVIIASSEGAWAWDTAGQKFESVVDFPKREPSALSQPLDNGTAWIVFGDSGNLAPVVGELRLFPKPHWTPHSIANLEMIGRPKTIFAETTAGEKAIVWVGGSKGIIRHIVENGPQAVRPSAPVVHASVEAADGSRTPLSNTLSYLASSIRFEFATTDYARRPQLRFESRLYGTDAEWVSANKEATRELTAVRDGTYKFEVRAVAETGLVSEPTVFTFTVLPPWWRTKLALWLEAIMCVGVIYGGVQWRIRTLRKRNAHLEQKVQERTSELAEANAAKTQFVANMSHDIRNPLSGIVGLTLALEDTPLDAQQRELVSTLRECTSYLSTLVDDVLDFASIEAGRIELHPAPFAPAEVLNSVVTALKAQCVEKRAFVTIETDPDIPRLLLGDAGRIQQILVNYLSNALKYGGGHIRVCASVARDSAGEVEFAIADEGPGLSEADKAKLFTQFNRLDAARNSHVKGTGLGLAACRLLADAMGGAVGVESEIGHGSRFFVRLPLIAAAEPVVVDDSLILPPTTILLVEDTDYNAIATNAVLRKLGLTCDRAANGAEALALFAEKRHHIVLLDRNLPDMDGTEVAGRIRELETDGRHAMIFAVTAYCTAEDRQKCLNSGMDAFVGKPLTPEKVRRALLAAAEQLLAAGSPAAPEVTAAQVSRNAEPPLPAIDMSLLEYLAEGSPGGLALQVDRYIDALRETHADLLRIRAARDATATGNAVHRVLGHARMINAGEFTSLLIPLETAAREGDFEKVDAMLPAVARHVDRLTAALRRHPGVLRA